MIDILEEFDEAVGVTAGAAVTFSLKEDQLIGLLSLPTQHVDLVMDIAGLRATISELAMALSIPSGMATHPILDGIT